MSNELRKLQPEDVFRFAAPGDPQVSPTGDEVVFVVRTFDREKNESHTRLFIVATEGKDEPRPLSAGPKDRLPRWSPDGQRIAFVSDRAGKPQLFIIDRNGGEAWQLPTVQSVQSEPAWSPGGRQIAFTAKNFPKPDNWQPYPGAPEGDYQRAQDQAQARLKRGNGEDKTEDVSDVKVITDFRFRFDGIGYFGDLKRQVCVVDVPATAPGPGEALDDVEARQLTRGDFNHDAPAWSPDGKRLVCVAVRGDETYQSLSKQDLWVVHVDSGELVQLVDGAGPIFAPVWSPDGRYIAFLGNDRRYGGSTTNALWLVPSDEGPAPYLHADCTCLTESLDRPVGASISSDMRYNGRVIAPCWVSEGLYFLVGNRGGAGVYRLASTATPGALAAEPGVVITSSGWSVGGFSVNNEGTVAFQAADASTTEDIYVQTPGEDYRRLTAVNHKLLSELELATVERFTYKGADDWDIDGWLLKPPGYCEDKRVPTVLFIHGGPHGVYGDAFMFQMQVVAARGMAVMYTDPRGSQTYGQDFAYAVVSDWGGKDYQDIMAGVDVVVNMGVADPDRLGVTGWSYGGFMTNWVVTQTQRFRAASAGACVSNRHNFYGTSDIGFTFGEHHWRGNPWSNPDRLLERSPLMYVENVTTPLMLVHGEGDLRCPIEQSDQMYIALKRLGKPVVYVRYPGEFHGFREPLHLLDRYQRLVAWFRHYLNGE